MKNVPRHEERGVALFFSIFALLLLTAIGAALIFMASTETSVNSNYHQEQVAYFAAKAGIEEARARMMAADQNTISPLPTAAPTSANSQIIYITNPGFTSAAVTPWDTSSTSLYPDQELCHDGYGTALFGTTSIPSPGVRCSNVPSGTWYTTTASKLPFYNSTNKSEVMPYAWVRIAPKVNGSMNYLNGSGLTVSYSVNSGSAATTAICWDGSEEVPLTAATCSAMLNAANAPMTDVYVLTALGVSSNRSNAARKVVQAEVALQPTPPFPYGLFATSSACPAISFSGNNPSTDSYTTAGGGTYSGTQSSTGGDIGSNGGVAVGNGNIGGLVGVLQGPPTGSGPCATPFSISSNGKDVGPNCPGPSCVPNSATYLTQPYVFPVPPAPSPLPPNTSYTPPSCAGGKKAGQCMVPGTYGNISITGTLTMAPGTYNINSLSMTGNAAIVVSPAGALTFNVGGCGDATCSAANALGNPLKIAGNGITDDSNPNDFTINYSGAGTVSIAGNGNVTAILNSPNAMITQQGNGNWYGSILGSQISLGGNAFFHFDRASALAPDNNGYYHLLGSREVPY